MNNPMVTLGISNDAGTVRADHDFYATPHYAVEELLKRETFSNNVWECACGHGHISEVLKNHGYNVKSTDLIDRGYGTGNVDFLKTNGIYKGDIVTNPPYFRNNALLFVKKALQTIPEGHKVAMFLRLLFIEGQGRRELFDQYPPVRIYAFSKRVFAGKNGELENTKGNSAMAFAWFVWEKGNTNLPTLHWI